MADLARIRARAVSRRKEKLKLSIGWADVVSAFQAADPSQRAAFARAIYNERPPETWNLINTIMDAHLTTQAGVEVDAAMADNAFTMDELEDLLM